MFVTIPLQTETKEPVLSNEWQFDTQIYICAADFAGELNGGATFDVSFDTLVDNLKMGFYGSFEARKEKWLISPCPNVVNVTKL